MKSRARKILNFFAFNLLFFALYLNFVHKDKQSMAIETEQATQKNAPAFGVTVLANKSGQQSPKNMLIENPGSKDINTEKKEGAPALKLSIN